MLNATHARRTLNITIKILFKILSYQLAFLTPGRYPFNAFIRNMYCP